VAIFRSLPGSLLRGLSLLALLGAPACDGAARTGSDAAVMLPGDASVGTNDPMSPGTEMDQGEVASLEPALMEGRLPGWIHASVSSRSLYVFTWRKPGDFFTFADFPLVPISNDVAEQLKGIRRHDEVRIKGTFIRNMAPITHIRLEAIEVVKAWQTDETPPARTPTHEIPAALAGKSELIGKVHAVANDGRLLVIEYGDAVVPLFVPNAALTRSLYRNDKIRVAFTLGAHPPRPTHLWVDTKKEKPLEVLESLVARHGQPFEAEGTLVRFPQSPQINRDIYAIQVTDADQVSREYTLFNIDPKVFNAVMDKLAQAWRSRPGQGVDGRNKLVNAAIRVRARGRFNVEARNQANAQIIPASADDVTVTFAAP
jgi:hypothetical protein